MIFFIKIIAGLLLIIIYSRYYIIRGDADIFKYFDDSEKIYNVLFINPIHYLRLVFGINADSEQLQKYMEGTYVWALQTSDYQHFIASEKIDLFNSHRLITRVNAVIRLFSSGCFGVHTVFMCFFSLTGLTALYKSVFPFLKKKKKLLILCVFFMPSLLLWSSGVLKEGFLFAGIGLAVYSFFKITHRQHSLSNIILFVFSLLLILFVKYYLLAALLPAMTSYFLAYRFKRLKTIYAYLPVYGLIFIIVALTPYIKGVPSPLKVLSDKQADFIRDASGGTYCVRDNAGKEEFLFFPPGTKLIKATTDSVNSDFKVAPGTIAYKYKDGKLTGEKEIIGFEKSASDYFWAISSMPVAGSLIKLKKLEPNILSFFSLLPSAIFNVFCRPHVFEISSIMMAPAAIENFFILLFIILCILRFGINRQNYNLLLFFTLCVLTWFIIVGITTPVLGNIVRYKSPLIPFLMVSGLLVYKPGKFL